MKISGDTGLPGTLEILKALSDRNRLRILCALKERELCVCQIIELLELAPSTVSKHLSVLSGAGILGSHKRGRWVYYFLSEQARYRSPEMIEPVLKSISADEAIKRDYSRLMEILDIDPEKLCRMQAGR